MKHKNHRYDDMTQKGRNLWVIILCTWFAGLATPVPQRLQPPSDYETIVAYPSFHWQRTSEEKAHQVRIQIAKDDQFNQMVEEDAVDSVLDWYASDKKHDPAQYWWRLRFEPETGEPGPWSQVHSFRVIRPKNIYSISPQTSPTELRSINDRAAASSSALIQFAPGTYYFNPGKDRAVFSWQNAANILIDGGGARIILQEPSAQLWSAEDCQNIMIGNFSLEYEPRPHTIATVLAKDPKGGTMDVEIVDGFSEARFPRSVNQFFCYALDPQDNRRLHPDRPGHLYLDPDNTQKLSQTRLRYQLREQAEYSQLSQMQPGDRIVACYRRWPISWIKRCTDLTLHDIAVSSSESALFMGGGNDGMKILRLSCRSEGQVYPTPAGWVTGNDRHGPWIESCVWEALADDGPNITGNLYLIESCSSPRALGLKTGPKWQNARWQKGDRLLFWNPITGIPVLSTTITSVTTSLTELNAGRQVVAVADELKGLEVGLDMERHTQVYNLSCQNNGFTARNNRLICGRRFGFNVKANYALIEKNYFEGLASSAIYIENEPTGWEGLCSERIVVQDNTMVECGASTDSARRQRASGVHVNLWRVPSHGNQETPWIGHQDLIIRRNTIVDWESVAIGVDNSRRVSITHNQLISRKKTGFELQHNFGVLIGAQTSDIHIEGNSFQDKRDYTKILDASPKTTDK